MLVSFIYTLLGLPHPVLIFLVSYFQRELFLVSFCRQKFTRFGCSTWVHCNRRVRKLKIPCQKRVIWIVSFPCHARQWTGCFQCVRTSCCPGRRTTKMAGCSAFIGNHLSSSNPLLILWPHFIVNNERLAHLWSKRKTILGGLGVLNPYTTPGI